MIGLGEAIDRFRRQRHDFAGAQQFGGAADGFLEKLRRVGGENLGCHAGNIILILILIVILKFEIYFGE
jgi:uncharacterized membrane-anchored protein